MHRLTSMLAVVVACGFAGTPAQRAQAAVLAAPGVRVAVDDMAVGDQVHCRPGRLHHRSRPHDGCRRAQRRGAVILQPAPPVRSGQPGAVPHYYDSPSHPLSLHEW